MSRAPSREGPPLSSSVERVPRYRPNTTPSLNLSASRTVRGSRGSNGGSLTVLPPASNASTHTHSSLHHHHGDDDGDDNVLMDEEILSSPDVSPVKARRVGGRVVGGNAAGDAAASGGITVASSGSAPRASRGQALGTVPPAASATESTAALSSSNAADTAPSPMPDETVTPPRKTGKATAPVVVPMAAMPLVGSTSGATLGSAVGTAASGTTDGTMLASSTYSDDGFESTPMTPEKATRKTPGARVTAKAKPATTTAGGAGGGIPPEAPDEPTTAAANRACVPPLAARPLTPDTDMPLKHHNEPVPAPEQAAATPSAATDAAAAGGGSPIKSARVRNADSAAAVMKAHTGADDAGTAETPLPAPQPSETPQKKRAPESLASSSQGRVGASDGSAAAGTPSTSTTRLDQSLSSAQVPVRPASSSVALRPKHISLGRRELLGKGTFGMVYRAMDLDTNRIIAVKEVTIAPGSMRPDQLESLRREICMMQKLDHPNIVKCLGEHWDGQQHLRIFMEYVPGGTISSVLRSFGAVTEAQAARYGAQMLAGLDYLHSKRIAHRDLKGDNLLVDVDGTLKLADFGTAKELATRTKSVAGTAFFMAPEVIRGTGHGVEADVWSAGCCIVEMLTGKPPFHTFSNQYAIMMHIAEIKDGAFPLPPTVSPLCKDFLERCFRIDPCDRASVASLREHEWLLNPPTAADLRSINVLNASASGNDLTATAGAGGAAGVAAAGASGGVDGGGMDSYNPIQSFGDH